MNKGSCFPIPCQCVFVYADHTPGVWPPCPSQSPEVGRLTHTLGYMGTTLSQTCLRSPPYTPGLSGCVFPDSHPLPPTGAERTLTPCVSTGLQTAGVRGQHQLSLHPTAAL